MTAQTILPIDRAAAIELSKAKGEPEWMTALRAEALELAETLELPKLEKTRIDRWDVHAYGSYKSVQALLSFEHLPEAAKSLTVDDNVIVQFDSGIVYAKLSEELTAQGVVFTDLESALKSHGDLVRQHFMSVVKTGENVLTALHTAMWSGGVFLYVPKNVKVEAPLQALFLTEDGEASFAPHVLIIADTHSSVNYVEHVLSVNPSREAKLTHNGVVEVIVKPGATVSAASIHGLAANMTDLTYRRAILENDAKVNFVIGELGNGNGLSDTTVILKGNGSSSNTKVICVGTDDQKLNITTRAIHHGKMSDSDMITRAVMRDASTAIINGITKIEKGSTGANGQQTEKVLMLNPKARGDANPILLIDEDDVKAGHAASVGQVNAEQIFYLMSRGISRKEATRLIIYGFLAPIVSEVPNTAGLDALQKLIERKLGQ